MTAGKILLKYTRGSQQQENACKAIVHILKACNPELCVTKRTSANHVTLVWEENHEVQGLEAGTTFNGSHDFGLEKLFGDEEMLVDSDTCAMSIGDATSPMSYSEPKEDMSISSQEPHLNGWETSEVPESSPESSDQQTTRDQQPSSSRDQQPSSSRDQQPSSSRDQQPSSSRDQGWDTPVCLDGLVSAPWDAESQLINEIKFLSIEAEKSEPKGKEKKRELCRVEEEKKEQSYLTSEDENSTFLMEREKIWKTGEVEAERSEEERLQREEQERLQREAARRQEVLNREAELRQRRPRLNLLVTEREAMMRDRPEDINYAAKQFRKKSNSSKSIG